MDVAEDSGCPEDWPDALKEMRTLDNLLRCPICCELINTAMIVPKCSHTYCSLCIRRYSCFKTQCPTCATAVSEPELLNNRLIDDIVTLFQQVRPVLLEVVKGAVQKGVKVPEIKKAKVVKIVPDDFKSSSWISIQAKNATDSKQRETQTTAKDSGRPFATFSPRGSSSKRKYVVSEFDDDFDDVIVCDGPSDLKKLRTDESETLLSAPHTPSVKMHQWSVNNSNMTPKAGSSSRSPSVMSPGYVATPTGRRPLDCQSPPFATNSQLACSPMSQTPSNSKKVPCPVCQAEVPERNINLHLDRCLSGSEKKEVLRSSAKRKLMPKLVYNLLKDGELRKKLNAVGLPTTGDRQTMISKHKEFTLIYNSECDSLKPRTAEEIVRDMMKAEQSKLKQSTINPVTSLQIKKGASTDEVEKAQKDYVKKHKSQFAKLIADAKKKMQGTQKASNSADSDTEPSTSDLKAEQSDVETVSSVEPASETGGTSGGSSPNHDSNLPALPLQECSSTASYQDDSSHSSSELFCDQGVAEESKDQNQISTAKTADFNLHFDDDSNCSDNSESLLSEAPVKLLESNDDADPTSTNVPKVTPVDLNEPISSSPGIFTDVLSQISDSNDIPLTQASKTSKGEIKCSGSIVKDKILENASQRSGVSFASSESSRLNDADDMTDYAPDPDELHESDNAEAPKKKERPKRKVQTKKKITEKTPPKKPARKGKAKTSLPEKVTPSPSENIDTNNLIDDPDFVEKPARRLRMRKSKA